MESPRALKLPRCLIIYKFSLFLDFKMQKLRIYPDTPLKQMHLKECKVGYLENRYFSSTTICLKQIRLATHAL